MIEKLEHHKEFLESEVAIRISELREARDAALSASRLKSQFLAMLTHEIRTPVAAINGYTELTIEELRFIDNSEVAIARLHEVLATSQELLEVFDRLLTFAKAEAGKAEVTVAPVDLEQLIGRVQSAMKPHALKNDNVLRVSISGEKRIDIDEGKLLHILLNLVSNACKFTHHGAIQLEVDSQPDRLRITVMDNGIGIPKDYQVLIFEPFRQIDMSDTRKYGGVGLGLAITQRFCELLGGRIEVESAPGVGSTFRVTLPLPVGNQPE